MNPKNPFDVKEKRSPFTVVLLIAVVVAMAAYLLAPKYWPEIQKQIAGKQQDITARLTVTCPQMKGYKVVKGEDDFSCNYTEVTSAKNAHEESHISPLDSNGCEIVNKSAKPDKNGGFAIKDMPGNVTIPSCVMPIEIVAKYDRVDVCYVNEDGDAVTKVRDKGKEFFVYCRGEKTGQPVSKDRYDALNACGGSYKVTEAENNNEPLRVYCKGSKIGQPAPFKVVQNFAKSDDAKVYNGNRSHHENENLVCEYGGSEYVSPVLGEDNIAKTSCTGIAQLVAMDKGCFPESDFAKIQKKHEICVQKYGQINIHSAEETSGGAKFVALSASK